VRRLRQIAKAIVIPPLHYVRGRLRAAELERQMASVDRAALVTALGRLPIAKDSVVLVHSSLKSLGFVEGGARTVVEALVEQLVINGGSTVLVPAYSIDGTMYTTLKSVKLFDVRKTPSNLGAIPEAFRRHPRAVRSLHPSHSFAAIGPKAEWLTANHHVAGSNFGLGTPMGRLLETQSYLLGLGTDIGHVTFYHCLEDIEKFPLVVYAEDGPFQVSCIDYNGVTHRLLLPAHAPGDLQKRRIDNPQNVAVRDLFLHWLERYADLTWHDIGQARCWLVDAQKMYRQIKLLMERNVTIYLPHKEAEAFIRSNLL